MAISNKPRGSPIRGMPVSSEECIWARAHYQAL